MVNLMVLSAQTIQHQTVQSVNNELEKGVVGEVMF